MRCLSLLAVVALMMVPCSAQPRVYFGNLHSHTSLSDGSGTPVQAYRHARFEAHLDFLAVTEHNHRRAPSRISEDPYLYNGSADWTLISAAEALTEPGEFVAIYGQEFSTIGSGNHANVLEVTEVIQTSDVPNGEWDALLNDWLRRNPDSQGEPALLLLNHPAQSSSPNALEYGIDDFDTVEEWRRVLDAHAQLINIVNGPSHEGSKVGAPSESEFLRYLNMGLHLAPTADQDNHLNDWGSAAETRTGVVAEDLTKSTLLQALRDRRVYATEDRNLRLVMTVEDSLMGSRFTGTHVPAAGSPLDVVLSIRDDDEPSAVYRVEVYADEIGGQSEADVISTVNLEGDGNYPISGLSYEGGNRYLFLKVLQSDDDGEVTDRAWLAPVWFEPTNAVGPEVISIGIEVDRAKEIATITNTGTGSIDLTGWHLVSEMGNQRFSNFTQSLGPGQTLHVLSGPNAAPGRGAVLWTNSYIWNNSGDPGVLVDAAGIVRARTQ